MTRGEINLLVAQGCYWGVILFLGCAFAAGYYEKERQRVGALNVGAEYRLEILARRALAK